MKRFRVLIAVDDYRSKYIKRYLEDIAEVVIRDLNKEDLKKEIQKGYDAVITGIYLPVTADIIEVAPSNLKVIGTISVGTDHIDKEAARKRRIKIVNASVGDICASKYSVAEHTFALLLTIIKKTHLAPQLMRSGKYGWMELKTGPWLSGPELFGKTLGIIGVGRIGTHVARIAEGFRMKVIGYDPYTDSERVWEDHVELLDSLDELLRESDFISINAELTEETYGMIGYGEVSAMKDGVYIVNTARGQIVVEDAIVDGLKKGKIAGYAADVLSIEPPDLGKSPLYREFLKGELNIVITPHTAPLTDKAPERYGKIVGLRVREVLTGETLVPYARKWVSD